MKPDQSTFAKLVTLGSARKATKAIGGTQLLESNMVLRYD